MRSTYQDDVSVVAGGWSFSLCDPHRLPGRIIAVNDAAHYLPYYNEILTMDRRWAEYRSDLLYRSARPVHLRENAARRLDRPLPRNFRVFSCDHESAVMSSEEGVLNGTNSGMCAINLAYQLAPRRVWLFGFDMRLGPKDEQYWYPPYPWHKPKPVKLREWSRQFEVIARQFDEAGIQVSVVGRSRLPHFKHIKPGAVPC